jgi:hypothetical protein
MWKQQIWSNLLLPALIAAPLILVVVLALHFGWLVVWTGCPSRHFEC